MQHRSSRGGAGLGCGGEKPHMEQHGESKGPGALQQSSTICFEKQKILLFFFLFPFYSFKVLSTRRAAWWNNNFKKWRCRFFIADSHLYNFVNASAPCKLQYLCLAEIPGHKSWQCSEYQQLHFTVPASQFTVSPSQRILVSCTLANTIPMFCLAVNGRSCPSII